MQKGVVFNIQKYSIHDGPGIRTTVFLKGCPLTCWWCHNPESQNPKPEIMFRGERCIECGECVKTCDLGVLSNSGIECDLCGKCTDACPTEARTMVGKTVTVEDVFKEIQKDTIFYDESGGGVTFSGGEPLMQTAFLKNMLMACQNRGIHTAVDTAGYTSWKTLEDVSHYTNLFLYDLKLMDDNKHKTYIGVSNKIILDNLNKLNLCHNNIHLRIPLIPGVNDDDENIEKTIDFIARLENIKKINILPYHETGKHKYMSLGLKWKMKDIQPPSQDYMIEISKKFNRSGLNAKIGG